MANIVVMAVSMIARLTGQIAVVEADALAWLPETPFEAIYEQTCLCALYPDHWRAYGDQLHRWLKPGGKLVVVDYHCPHRGHPLRYLLRPVLRALEPDALDLWANELDRWLPGGLGSTHICKKTFFGGLYQMLAIAVPKQSE